MSDRNSGTEFIDGLIAADRSFCRNSARAGLGRYALCDLGHFPKLRSYGSIGFDRGLAFQPKLSFFKCFQRTPQRKMTTGLISAYVRRIAPVSAALVPHVTFVHGRYLGHHIKAVVAANNTNAKKPNTAHAAKTRSQ